MKQTATGRPPTASDGWTRPLRVASLVWHLPSEIHENQGAVVSALGHAHRFLRHDETLPADLDVVLVQGPYGSLLPLALQLREGPATARPVLVYWYQQNLDLATAPWIRDLLVPVFSDLQRHDGAGNWPSRLLGRLLPRRLLERGGRLRGVGDILWLHRNGLLDVLGLSSTVYAEHLARQGIESIVVSRGYHPSFGAPLGERRDLALVWMGKVRSRHRRLAIHRLANQLAAMGHTMQIHDGYDHPLVYGNDRMQLLNRARFVLNLSSHPDDELSIRHFVAAANGAVVISEPNNNRYPFVAQKHFLSMPAAEMPAAIDYYVRHEDERRAMAEQMYRLVTTELTLERSIERLLDAAKRALAGRPAVGSG